CVRRINNNHILSVPSCYLFFLNHTPTTQIHTLSLHDALPILRPPNPIFTWPAAGSTVLNRKPYRAAGSNNSMGLPSGSSSWICRSEEHTSELQSRSDLVCRLLLEKKKKNKILKCVHTDSIV